MRKDSMLQDHVGKFVALMLCACALMPSPIRGQDQPSEKNEIKAVFRISKKFLNDTADKVEIVADVPLSARVLSFHVTGQIHGRGKVSIDSLGGSDQAVFVANSRGDGQVFVTGARRIVVVEAPAGGPFTASTLIRFDGRRCTRISTTANVEVHAELERITTRRDGFVGRAVGRVALPVGKHFVPLAERRAVPIAESIVENYVNETADKIIARLNEKLPVEDSVNRLYPNTVDWVFRMSADSGFIQAAYGPPNAKLTSLPPNPKPLADAHLEVWLRSTGKEAKVLEQMSNKPLAKQLVRRYLESTLPRLAALAEEVSVVAIDSWVVISVGPRKTK
jgi:hypothetical protein